MSQPVSDKSFFVDFYLQI